MVSVGIMLERYCCEDYEDRSVIRVEIVEKGEAISDKVREGRDVGDWLSKIWASVFWILGKRRRDWVGGFYFLGVG